MLNTNESTLLTKYIKNIIPLRKTNYYFFISVQLDIIKQQTLAALLCRNFKMGSMQPAAFVSALVG